jgi:hypothetical protein
MKKEKEGPQDLNLNLRKEGIGMTYKKKVQPGIEKINHCGGK